MQNTKYKIHKIDKISHRRCGAEIIFSEGGRAGLKTSILISQIVEKLWANEKRAVQLRQEGNKLFKVNLTKVCYMYALHVICNWNKDNSEAGLLFLYDTIEEFTSRIPRHFQSSNPRPIF